MDQSTNTGQSDKEWTDDLVAVPFLGRIGSTPVLHGKVRQRCGHVVNLWWIGNMVDH